MAKRTPRKPRNGDGSEDGTDSGGDNNNCDGEGGRGVEDDGGGDGGSGDYEIGYGKPPRASQWSKGQSGNPRGPKKGSRGLKKDLHNALNAKHAIRDNGRIIKGTTQELAMYTLAKRAASGDVRAIKQLSDLVLQLFGPEDRGGERQKLSAQDQQLVERLLERANPPPVDQSEDGSIKGADDKDGERGREAGDEGEDDDEA
jgi:hypothetical protein